MMLRVILRRLLYAIPAVWLMISALFLLSRILPGTFGEQQILNTEGTFYDKGSQQDRTTAYNDLLKRTNQHLPVFYAGFEPVKSRSSAQANYSYLVPRLTWNGFQNQYHLWLTGLFTGDMGLSFVSSRPVTELIWEAAGTTVWLLLLSFAITLSLALLVSLRMVSSGGERLRNMLLPVLIVLDSVPFFVLCLVLLLLFANPDMLQLFPVFGLGYVSLSDRSVWSALAYSLPYLVLPIVCLVLANLPYITNQFYSSLKGTMQADYIRTARAKGLPERQVIRKHALRNALLPVITILTDVLPALVAGAVVIETIFAIPGIGRLLVSSVLSRDFPVIVGIVVVIALVKMLSHVLADILYALADPRINQHNR